MSTVVFAQNMTLVADGGSEIVLYTDPYPADQYNHAEGVITTNAHFSKGGTAQCFVRPEGSNDGVQWQDVGSATEAVTTAGTSIAMNADSTAVYYSFYRLKITAQGGTDWCMYNIDVHVCFKHV